MRNSNSNKVLRGLLRSKIFRFTGVLALLFLLIQCIGPAVTNAPVTHPLQAPADVAGILKRACYDCHSNETRTNLLTGLAPFSWYIARDVNKARARFNFSTFDTLSPAEQQGFIWEMVNMVLDGKMPLATYKAVHAEARLTAGDISVLKAYAASLNPSVYHDSLAIRAAGEQRRAAPYAAVRHPDHLPVAPNGVAYSSIKDYRNWQVISTTNRFDNNRSIRIIYGNAIAANAVRNNRIKPWPEGSIIVKVVWDIIEEKNGDILPGRFNNVQMMIKDGRRYKQSAGWGFAKFTGAGLVPYGKDASFNAACFNCHKAASEYGYVFNIPLPDGQTVAVNQL